MSQRTRPAGRLVLAAALIAAVAPTFGAALQFDIVVSGGSFSAPAAAIAAARENPTAQVLLIEPTDWLGGQATSQGISAIDNSYHAPANSIMAANEPAYYPADYLDWLDLIKTAPPAAPGEGYDSDSGWVSRHCYDPRTGAWALDQLVDDFPNITVLKMTVVKDVTTTPVVDAYGTGAKITALQLIQRTPVAPYEPFDDFLSTELPDWYDVDDSVRFTKQLHTVTSLTPGKDLVVIEASELGDVMVLSGAKYTQGREVSTETISEAGALPAYNDDQSMAIVYPFCMTTSNVVVNENYLKTPWGAVTFDNWYNARVIDYFSFGSSNWRLVWTYRRLLSTGSHSSTVINVGDVSMQNWNPGNDYRQANWLLGKAATDAEAATDWQGGANLANLSQAEMHATTWYFYMKNNKPTAPTYPSTDTQFMDGADALNMMDTEHGLAKFPYIRCTRRIVGLDNFRITGRYFVNTLAAGYANETSYRYFDSAGIGNYTADVRPLLTSTGIAPPFSNVAPFYIPYRSLASHNIRNLLACGKTSAQTYVTNSAYRLHPIEWQGGSAAGVAAAHIWDQAINNYQLLEIARLRPYQTAVALNAPIRWLYRSEPALPPQDGDLIVNGFQAVPRNGSYTAEIYHPTGVRADVYANGNYIGQTTTRSNGRLLFNHSNLDVFSPVSYVAHVFDGSDNQLAVLSTTVSLTDYLCNTDPRVTDNDEGSPNYTKVGTWSSGSAQGDKWCTAKSPSTYDFQFNNDGLRTLRWRLKTGSPGVYRVDIWYSVSGNRSAASPFRVVSNNGATITNINVNQKINGGSWVSLGNHTFVGNNDPDEFVELRNAHSNAAELVIGDAVRVTPLNVDSVRVH